ncbi:hypothetical protein ACFX2A_014693 [Malus domestica]
MSRMACTIAGRIAQCKGHIMPPVQKSVPKRMLGTKFGLPLESLTIMKSYKVDSAAKVAPMLTLSADETDSSAGKEETACMGSCEKSTKPASREAAEICVLLKPDLLEDMDDCAKFIDGFKKATKEVLKTMAAEAYSSVEEIKRLDSELIALNGLDAIQVKYESAENEIGCYIPHIQDFEYAVSELRFATYAKDEKLIAAYNQVIHFRGVVDRLRTSRCTEDQRKSEEGSG